MRYLLDTHTALWFIEGDSLLSKTAKSIIENTMNEIYLSNISLFEISIKHKIGKLDLQKSIPSIIQDFRNSAIEIMALSDSHIIHYGYVSFFDVNRDPFDRMLIATALAENFTIISKDPKFSLYSDIVQVIW